jgi:ABC-type spermidine/putrescine transport system permease subunit I
MKFLLPYRFKKIGVYIAPIGFALWICMQKGLVTKLLVMLFGMPKNLIQTEPPYHIAIVVIAILSFFSFLAGLFFITFSKEKIEDEFVHKTRLDSFQFAALLQILFIILGFTIMLIYKEPKDSGLMLFFVTAIFLFWISFIGRFNFILHSKN